MDQARPNTFARIITLSAALTSVVWFGCRKIDAPPSDKEEIAIRSLSATYERWLISKRPFLTNVPASLIYRHDMTILRSDGKASPVIEYYLKAGEWQGLIILAFVLDVDRQMAPVGFRERRVTFVELPARRIVAGENGRKRTEYCGLSLWPNEMEGIVDRVIRGDSFEDLRKRADAERTIVYSRFEDTDDWRSLGAR